MPESTALVPAAAVEVVARPLTRIGQALAVLREAHAFAELLAGSQFVPNAYRGKSGDVMACVAMGQVLGLSPWQALQGIAVINGRPCVWGDAALAVVRAHPEFEDIEELLEPGKGDADAWRAVCIVTRRGQTPVKREYSVADAKRAGLWGKGGPWTLYPKRMLAMRARGFAIRDAFADALCGVVTREEAEDGPPDVAEAPPLASLPEGRRIRLRPVAAPAGVPPEPVEPEAEEVPPAEDAPETPAAEPKPEPEEVTP